MKWTILISLLIISAESRNLFKRGTDHHEERHLGEVYKMLSQTDFKSLVLISFAQLLPKCSLEEISTHVEQITTLADTCAHGARHADCGKPLVTLFLDHICAIPELGSKYEWSTECCAKHDPERSDCFNKHKVIPEGTKLPYKKPSPDEVCAAYKDNKEKTLGIFIHKMASKHPHLYSPAILGFTYQYNTICSECCDEEDKDKCFSDRMAELKKQIYIVEGLQKETCQILDNFKTRTLTARNAVKVCQKYPAASNERLEKLIEEVTHLNVDCCHGNMLECMIERVELTEHTCQHHEEISSKLKSCCDKPVLERTKCIIDLDNDEIPATLSVKVTEFIEDPLACGKYAKEQDKYLLRFVMEYSKRNPALSIQMIMQAGKGYEELLKKCCAELNPLECLKKGEELLINGIKESKELLEKNCADYEKLGSVNFQIDVMYRYIQRIPQVSTPGMYHMTRKMTEVAKHCCHLPEEKQMPCADQGLSLIMGEMCEMEKTHPINEGVKKCCWETYSGRRPCFTALGTDESFVAPEITADTLGCSADVCNSDEKRLEVIISVIKLKIGVNKEAIDQFIGEYTKVVEECCAAADPKECFHGKETDLIEKVKHLGA